MMMKPILAAAFILTASSAALAGAAGANPGMVVGNVYERLYATYGYHFSFGYSPPPDGYVRAAPARHHTSRERERIGAAPRIGNGTSVER